MFLLVVANQILTKFYLKQADVFDHMEQILTSLDIFSAIAENLINFTFNVSSFQPFHLGLLSIYVIS